MEKCAAAVALLAILIFAAGAVSEGAGTLQHPSDSYAPPETKPIAMQITDDRPCLGDINGDGRLDNADLEILAGYVEKGAGISEDSKCADLNGDMKITSEDLDCLGALLAGSKSPCMNADPNAIESRWSPQIEVHKQDSYSDGYSGYVLLLNGLVDERCGEVDTGWCAQQSGASEPEGLFLFDWGDGTESCSSFAASHTYELAGKDSGTYTVTVSAKNTCGFISEVKSTFTISEGAPAPALEVRSIMTNPEAPVAGEPFDVAISVITTRDVPFKGDTLATLSIIRGDYSGTPLGKVSKEFRVDGLLPGGVKTLVFENNKNLSLPDGEYVLAVSLSSASDNESAIKGWGASLDGGVQSNSALTLKVLPRAPPANAKPAGGQLPPLWLYSISAILVAALVVAFVVIYYKKLKPGAAAEAARVAAAEAAKGASAESDGKLTELYRKRDEIEEMIKIAKVKYYKRTLDEESYKEIIKDHQQKLIEIEARIAKMEGTIKELQGQIKKGGPTA